MGCTAWNHACSVSVYRFTIKAFVPSLFFSAFCIFHLVGLLWSHRGAYNNGKRLVEMLVFSLCFREVETGTGANAVYHGRVVGLLR